MRKILVTTLAVTAVMIGGCATMAARDAKSSSCCPSSSAQESSGRKIKLFNGKNLDGWYHHTVETGYENPGIFTVSDGILKISGGAGDTAYYGGLITNEEYENYRLTFEYMFPGPTYGRRLDRTRDTGVLLHSVGSEKPGPWMISYEYQIIEGGTGDLLLVYGGRKDENGNVITLTCTAEVEFDGKARYFKPGAPLHTWQNSGRLNWWGRDPEWKDVVGFRGRNDVESPLGEWTTNEIIARGDTLEFYTNGKLVNRAHGLSVTKGKLLFQTEGAEVWFRNIELEFLD